MRAKAVVPRLCGLGARVYYTHRATGVQAGRLRDVGRAESHDVHRLLYGRALHDGHNPAPVARQGKLRPLHRWVVAWPQAGYGTVVGLTYRASGWTHPGGGGYSAGGYEPDYDPPYFVEYERHPVYEVKATLRGKPLLVPVWACVPLPPPDVAGVGVWQDNPPHLFADNLDWAGWCAWWCGAAAQAVAA